MRALLIAEKPSLKRDIESAYRKMKKKPYDIDFFNLRGHAYSLVYPEDYKDEWGNPWRLEVLPMVPDKFKLKLDNSLKKEVSEIKKKLKENKYDLIINACDAAREGELIFTNFYESLPKANQLPIKRLWASDTTEKTLQKALENLIGEKDMENLKDAAKLRSYWDWIFGMNMTRLFTIINKNLVSVGRVIAPTLNFVVERAEEIKNFKSEKFYEMQSTFKKGKDEFIGRLEVDGKVRFKEVPKLPAIKDAKVISIEKKRAYEYAPPMYSLPDIQKEADKAYGIGPSETLSILQNLYEKHKILSYPRTDSRFIPTEMAKDIRPYLTESAKVFKVELNEGKIKTFKDNKRYVDDKKIADHHALMPTLDFKDSDLKKLNDKELKIFKMVIQRLVQIFMDDYAEDKTTVLLEKNKYRFRAVGSTVVNLGFKALWKASEKVSNLPELKEGEIVNIKKIEKKEFNTNPPEMFTKGTLLGAMDNAGKKTKDSDLRLLNGIGTAATRADIIERLFTTNLCELKGKYIYPTKKGEDLIKLLRKFDLHSPDMTAKWELSLKSIEDGKSKANKEMEGFVKYMDEKIQEVIEKSEERMKNMSGTIVGICPKCGAKVIQNDYSYVCEGSSQGCDFKVSKTICGAEITSDMMENMLKGEATDYLDMKFKSGEKGKMALKFKKDGELEFISKPVAVCPACGKGVKETSKYYLCENYKDGCDFIIGKEICKAKITLKDLESLLKGKGVKKEFTWKNGKKSEAELILKEDKTGAEFNFGS